jgi:protein-S-isoprenylcysteine O-methyltransferase Ste14
VAWVLFQILSAVWVLGEVAVRVRSLFRTGAEARDRGSFLALLASLLVGLGLGTALAASVPGAAVREGHDAVVYAALTVMAAGLALRFTAVIVLGRFFTVVVMVGGDQHVVESGPYRWLRHPSYTGLLLIIAGFLLASTANWLALVGIVPVLAGVLYRIRVEERALAEELGEPYRAYMRRTRRLVPYIY